MKHKFFVARISKNKSVFSLLPTVLLSIYLVGCSDQVRLPSADQLAEFENIGPVCPSVDMDCLVQPEQERTAIYTEYSTYRSVLTCLYGDVKDKQDTDTKRINGG